MDYRYTELARTLAQRIDEEIYRPGERLPSVRITSAREGVSPATAVAAYRQLELDGYIESRPRSGFFVRPQLKSVLAEPATSKPPVRPKLVTGQELVLQLVQNGRDPRVLNLGATVPDVSYLPTRAVSQAVSAAAHKHRTQICGYETPAGLPALRQQIAKRMAEAGYIAKADDIVITAGCQEALYLSLKAVTQPGDIVAIESPTYYGLLQALDALGLKALEIPTHPRDGISISALQLALEQWPVKACVVISNFSNPLGCLLTDERKQRLVKLIDQFTGVTLIEDDIYGELSFDHRRPRVLKSWDKHGNVVLCSSFSKTLTGLRIGWVASEKLQQRLQYEKFVTSGTTAALNQLAMTRLLSSGRYDRHLRSMQVAIAQSVSRMIDRISRNFPASTKITRPVGGFAVWLELPKSVNAVKLAAQALEHNISIAPGPMFSPTQRYQHCIRLSCAIHWSERVEKAIMKLGDLVKAF